MELPDFLINPNPLIYEENNYVVLDFETTIGDNGSWLSPINSIVLTCWRLGAGHPSFRGGSADNNYFKFGNEFGLAELIRDIKRSSFIVAHNAKFELQWLSRAGLELGEVLVFDTMIGDYVIGGNRYAGLQNLSLEKCAQRRLQDGKVSIISKMFKAKIDTPDIPESWLLNYCQKDVDLTERLFLAQRDRLRELNLLPVMFTRCLATPVLADLEKNGMVLDADLVRTKFVETELAFVEAERKLSEFAGGINMNSPAQLGVLIYETLGFDIPTKRRGNRNVPILTDSGKPSTAEDTLALLNASNKRQRTFLELYRNYKEQYTALTKYLKKFMECCDNDAGLMHATFNQTTTQTHRLSSSGAKYKTQFQNFPRMYKHLFTARNAGWKIGEGDGAQLEFRAAGHLGRDRVARSEIIEGKDVHSVTAEIIGVSRQDAKEHTFKPLYGGTQGTPEEMAYYAYFREHYPEITATQDKWIDTVLRDKYLVTEWGMRYYWPDTRMDRSGYITNTTSICNYPVQAFATAECIPVALVYFWHRIRSEGLQMFLINTVHDSIIAELPDEEIADFHRLCQQCLIDDVYQYLDKVYDVQLTVPLGCGVMIGTHWGSKDETKYEAREELYA